MTADEIEQYAGQRAIRRDELKKLIRERNSLGDSGEAHCLEMKRGLATSGHRKREDWTKLLLEAVSMSNSAGGYIIFGVGDEGELIGVDNQLISLLDPSRIQDQLSKYAPESRVTTQLTVTEYYDKKYTALWVSPGSRIIVFDENGDYTDEHGQQDQAFKRGVLYVRDGGGCSRASQTDLDQLVQRRVEERLSTLVARIEKVIHVPPESNLVATHPDNPSQAYRLVDSGEGQPVRITSDPDEPAVPLREVLRTDIPYEATEHEVSTQVRFWKTKPDHRVSREVCFSWFLKRNEIAWDADSALFCFLSACSSWGYPLYWANWLFENEQDLLRTTVDRFITSPTYPEIEYAAYVAAAFFWNERSEILSRIKNTDYSRAKKIARKIEEFDNKEPFMLRARAPGQSIRVEDEEYVKEELLGHREIGVQTLEKVVELRRDASCGDIELEYPDRLSSAGHQLDLICFTPLPGN